MIFAVAIPGVFALAWIMFGGAGLPLWLVFVSAIAAIAMLLMAWRRSRRVPLLQPGHVLGKGYWVAVIFELAAAMAGIAVVNAAALPPSSIRGWIAIVVGLHFFLLSHAWFHTMKSLLSTLGAVLILTGAASFIASIAGAPAAIISAFGGQIPGLTLAGFTLAATFRDRNVNRSSTR